MDCRRFELGEYSVEVETAQSVREVVHVLLDFPNYLHNLEKSKSIKKFSSYFI